MAPLLPFRWRLIAPQASRLPDLTRVLPVEAPWPGYRDELLALTARVWLACGPARPVFVGRSCESVFDLWAALSEGTAAPDPRLLLLSTAGVRGPTALESPGLRANLCAAGLDPAAVGAGPVALVDVVADGGTLMRVAQAIRELWRARGGDWRALRCRLRVVALRSRPGAAWDRAWEGRLNGLVHRPRQVLVDERLWDWLAGGQPKLTPSHPAWRWDEPAIDRPPGPTPLGLSALSAAVELVAWGREPATRAAFARLVRRRCGDPGVRRRRGWAERRARRAWRPARDEE